MFRQPTTIATLKLHFVKRNAALTFAKPHADASISRPFLRSIYSRPRLLSHGSSGRVLKFRGWLSEEKPAVNGRQRAKQRGREPIEPVPV